MFLDVSEYFLRVCLCIPEGSDHPAHTPINDSEWHWIVATVDSAIGVDATSEMRIYVDGVLDLALSLGRRGAGYTRYVVKSREHPGEIQGTFRELSVVRERLL
jgi:hypothetical protein